MVDKMHISQAAFDLIVEEETGGPDYYRKTEQHTDWPGGLSGVTIGCGYDLGYATPLEIQTDWGDKLPAAMVGHLRDCAGIHGSPAHALARELRNKVTVPWSVALDVFKNHDVPKWEKIVATGLSNTDLLSGDSFGALVSLAFNRGASWNLDGDRYREMRTIKHLMDTKQFAAIPEQFRLMKRLWKNTKDLRDRREHEARLFEHGLVLEA